MVLRTPRSVTPRDEERVYEHMDEKFRTMGELPGFLKGLIDNVKLLYRMLRDPEFKIGWTVKAKIIACLLYFITPIDVIPDFILGVGYLDDALVVGYAVKTLADVIKRYRTFHKKKQPERVVDVDGQVDIRDIEVVN